MAAIMTIKLMKTVGRKNACLAAAALLGLGTAARGAEPQPATGASVDETLVQEVLHVSPSGDDANPGTEAAPLGSFTTAMQRALEHKSQGVGVKVLLHDGIYRESIGGDESGITGMSPEPDTDAPLVIEAVNPGRAILSGSEIRTGWTQDGEVWSADWPHRMGAGEHFQGPRMRPVAFERHLVFVDGAMLRQVMSRNALRPGTFFIDEEETNSVYVHPSAPTDLNEANVETAVRQKLLFLHSIRNVVVRGLVFEHDNQPYGRLSLARGGWGAPLFFRDAQNILIEDCLIRNNSSVGLQLRAARDVTIRNTTIAWSGRIGMGASDGSVNILVEDSAITRSNFRGHWGNYIDGWYAAGFKYMNTRRTTFRRVHIHDNWSTGFWWDIDNTDILVEDCLSIRNHVRGIFIELNQGPTLVRNSVFALTSQTDRANEGFQGGVQIATSPDVTFENCLIFGNEGRQINFWDQVNRFEGESIRNFETRQALELPPKTQLTLRNNYIASTGSGQLLYESVSAWGDRIRPLVDLVEFTETTGSRYAHPNRGAAFSLQRRTAPVSLAAWQQATGADGDARWVQPLNIDLDALLEEGVSEQKIRQLIESAR